MKWPQTTCTVVRVFPEVAYVGGWWVVFGLVGGAAVETLFIKISGAFTGVYVSLWCLCKMTGTKWNLRWRIKRNTEPNSRPRRLLAFCFHLCDENSAMFRFLFVFNTWLSKICRADGAENVVRWNIMSLPNKMWALHVKNKWPLCHAWHQANMNC